MPGTIHVSVLGFKDLPSSPISLKVSMGKRVYQTGDEDFSFPLTTLRDNMIITLHDTEGHEIFNTGVQTMSVVQKGFWDEFLPLQGGGHVQLKLRFVLSEEERNRIRKMRESAMKKRHSERFSSSLRQLESGGAATSVATSSFHVTQEVSERQFLDVLSAASSQDSPKSTATDPEVANSLAIHAGELPNPEGVPRSKEDTANNHKQIVPTNADGSQEISSAASSSKRMNKHINYDKSLVKIDAKSDLVVSPQRPTMFQETLSSMMKNSVASQQGPHKQYLLEGTPSNVRMIDADGSQEISSAASSSNRMDNHINYDKALVKIDATSDRVGSTQKPTVLQVTSSSTTKSSIASQQGPHKQDLLEGTPINTDADGSQEISPAGSSSNRMDKRINYDKSLLKIDAKSGLVGSPQRPTILQSTSSSMVKSSIASQQGIHKQDIDKGAPSNNDTDRSKEISSAASVTKKSQEHVDDTNLIKPAEKIGAKLHLVDMPKRPKLFQEALSIQQKNEQLNQPEKQEPLRKTPSNVRKMISAFETSLDKDTRRIKPPPVEVQSHGVAVESLEEKNLKDKPKPAKLNLGKLNNPFLTGELKRIQTNETKREEPIGLDQSLQMRKTSPESGKLKDESSSESKVKETESFAKPQENLVKSSVVEATTSPEKTVHKEPVSLHQQTNLLAVDQNTCGPADESAIQSRNSLETNMQEPLESLKTEDSCGNKHNSLESSGAWIFADHTRRLCVTTGSKHVIDLVEHCGIEEKNHKGEDSFCLQENLGKCGSFPSESCSGMEKADMTSNDVKKLRPENSSEAENPVGQIGQVIKVAIMVAFGALVLLTRQGKPR